MNLRGRHSEAILPPLPKQAAEKRKDGTHEKLIALLLCVCLALGMVPAVGFNTTAWGTTYQYSSAKRLSFVKNGSYYDVDQGVEPDHVIDNYAHFYDREALTEFIHGLY